MHKIDFTNRNCYYGSVHRSLALDTISQRLPSALKLQIYRSVAGTVLQVTEVIAPLKIIA
jgi:hypothetical protein